MPARPETPCSRARSDPCRFTISLHAVELRQSDRAVGDLAHARGGAALAVIERLMEAIRTYSWEEFDSSLRVTMSIGLCESSDFGDSSELVQRADESLYAAKHAGRDRVHQWSAIA